MIEKEAVRFTFNYRTLYWRHFCKWNDTHNLAVDFVKNTRNRLNGYRVNIRVIPNSKPVWQNNGRPVNFGHVRYKVSTCWIGADGRPVEIDDSKNNKHQSDLDLEDFTPFMKHLHDVITERMAELIV